MDVQRLETLPPPPGVFGSLRAGFDVVSNKVALILLPLGLDLLLWLGPRLSVDGLLSPYFKLVFEQMRRSVVEADLGSIIQYQTTVMARLQDFNLLGLLSKLQIFPIGISSLSAQTMPVQNPLGNPNVVIISSIWILLGLSIVLVPLGWIGGGVYFRQVASSILGKDETRISLPNAVFQTILLSVMWLVCMVFIAVPSMFVISLIHQLISPILANFVFIVFLLLTFWLIVPLFFVPHGIFVRRQNAFYSIYSSLRLVRFSLPTSGMFVLSVFILSRGLDRLWSVPMNESWLTLVGIAGHAFITTVLLAASFIYYRDMTDWLKTVYDRFQQLGRRPSSTV